MAATNYSPIQLYYSTTASAAPAAGNLVSGELAINITDGKLYYKDNAGTVQLLSTSTTANGTANGVLYLNGSKVATSGSALTFDGTALRVKNNGAYNPFFAVINASSTNDIASILYDQGTDIWKFINPSSYAGSGIDFCTGASNLTRYHIDTGGTSIWSVAGSEQMRLTSTGLGIGTSSIGHKLVVASAGGSGVYNINTTASNIQNPNSSGSEIIGAQVTVGNNIILSERQPNGAYSDRTDLAFITNTGYGFGQSEKMRLDSSGNLGIGTTSPSGKFQVQATNSGIYFDLTTAYTPKIIASGALSDLQIEAPGNGGVLVNKINGSASTFQWYNGASELMRLNNTGLGIGTSSPYVKLQVTGTIKVATGNAQGILSLGDGNGVTTNVGLWRGAANAPTTDGNFLNLGGYDGIVFAVGAAAIGSQTERMRLDASGNLGIGTTSPSERLEVVGVAKIRTSGGSGIQIVSAATPYIQAFGASGNNVLQLNGQSISFWSGASYGAESEKMRLDASGNLGIGTSSPGSKLDILNTTTAQAQFSYSASIYGRVGRLSNGNYEFSAYENGANLIFGTSTVNGSTTERMRLDSSGNLGIGTSSPAQKLQVHGAIYANNSTNVAFLMQGSQYNGSIANTSTANTYSLGYTTDASTHTSVLYWNASGNLGLGVTPSGWLSSNKAFQFGYGAVRAFSNSANTYLDNNNYVNTSGTDIYLNTGYAGRYRISDNQHIWYQAPSGTAGNAISFTQAMTLDAGGNLGIGTTNPAMRLEVVGSGGNLSGTGYYISRFLLDKTTYKGIALGYDSSGQIGIIYPESGGAASSLAFWTYTGSAWGERARIDSSGNLLVGTTSSKSKTVIQGQLSVGETGAVSGAAGIYLYANDALSDNSFLCRQSSGTGTTTWYIGNQAITTSSDIRLKENVKPSERNALELLNQWEIIDHTWNDPSDKCENNRNSRGVWTGISAQQVQQVTPWLVNKPIEDVNEDGSINPWTMDFGYAVPLLVKAIQEQQAQIESLRKRLADAGIA